MKFDHSRLRKRIKFQNSVEQIAALLKMSPTTLYIKLEGKSDFKQSEIVQIAKILDMPKDDIVKYFFDTGEW